MNINAPAAVALCLGGVPHPGSASASLHFHDADHRLPESGERRSLETNKRLS